MKIKSLCLLFLTLAFVCKGQKQDQVWPQFRGLNGSGVSTETANPPVKFENSNLLWKAELPKGNSSPVVWADRLFVTGYVEGNKELQTICFDKNSGKILWSNSVKPDTVEKAHAVGSPAQSTVATDGKRIISYFGSSGLYCYDMNGNLQWRYRIKSSTGKYGNGTSPVISGSKVILFDDVSGRRYLMAVDAETGKLLWKKAIQNPLIPNVGGHSTPCIINNTIILHRIGEVAAFSLTDGSKLWNLPILTSGNSTPIVSGNKVFVSCWYNFSQEDQRSQLPGYDELLQKYDKDSDGKISYAELPDNLLLCTRPEISELQLELADVSVKYKFRIFDINNDRVSTRDEWNYGLDSVKNTYYKPSGLIALNLGKSGQLSEKEILWRVPLNMSEVPSPLYYKKRVYMIKDGGILTCTDPESGKVIYTSRIGNPCQYLASPVAANGYIYLSGYNGKMKIVKAGDKFEVASEYDFKDNLAATPAIIGNTIYIRTKGQLLAYSRK